MYLSFIEYLKSCQKRIHILRYQQDIQYRCVLFHQYQRQYRNYCKQHQLAHQYDDVAFEVQQFEKRMQDYYDRLGE